MESNKNTINHRGTEKMKGVINVSKPCKWFGEKTDFGASKSTEEWLWRLFEVLLMRAAWNN